MPLVRNFVPGQSQVMDFFSDKIWQNYILCKNFAVVLPGPDRVSKFGEVEEKLTGDKSGSGSEPGRTLCFITYQGHGM